MPFLRLYFIISCFTITSALQAQNITAEEVKTAVNQLFTGMKQADSSMIANCFTPSAMLHSVSKNKDNETVIHETQISKFAQQIGKLSKDDADERITFGEILIDGDLASVWTPYQFYYKGQLSHCGVNSFQLVKLNGSWKINYIIDTRRKAPCKD